MTTLAPDFSALDRPEVLMVLFHPRREHGEPRQSLPDAKTKIPGVKDLLIHIIPFSDGQALFEASASADQTLLKIPAANHNDILAHGFADYLAAVQRLTASCS